MGLGIDMAEENEVCICVLFVWKIAAVLTREMFDFVQGYSLADNPLHNHV